MRRSPIIALTASAFGLLTACGGGSAPQTAPTDAESRPAASQSTPSTPTASPSTEKDAKEETKAAGSNDSGTSHSNGRQTVVVTRVIDGDTFEARGLGKGPVPRREVDVRMLEINTVEEGECGYEAATDKLASLLDEKVTIERDQDLKDQYGRWLLYVWSDGVFVNHEMVQTGYAEAVLYEPNDKYWDKINAADTSETYTPWPPCHTPEPEQEEQEEQPPPQQKEKKDDSGSGYLFPPPPPDKDCSEVSASDFPVRPGDPHRFDADGDGVGCES